MPHGLAPLAPDGQMVGSLPIQRELIFIWAGNQFIGRAGQISLTLSLSFQECEFGNRGGC